MENDTGGFLFKFDQPEGSGADGDGLKNAQEKIVANKEASHDPAHTEKCRRF